MGDSAGTGTGARVPVLVRVLQAAPVGTDTADSATSGGAPAGRAHRTHVVKRCSVSSVEKSLSDGVEIQRRVKTVVRRRSERMGGKKP